MRALPFVLVLWVLSTSASAHAQQAEPADWVLQQTRDLILYARYPEAIARGQTFLQRPDLRARERNIALELVATAQIANRQDADAQATLRTLYARDPQHRLSDPDASPPVVSLFARVRESAPPPVDLDLVHRSPGVVVRHEPPLLELRVESGSDAVDEVRIAYRHAGETADSQVVMNAQPGGLWQGRIPIMGTAEGAIEVSYHLVALAPSGAVLGRVGSEREPLSLRIPASGARRIADGAIPPPDGESGHSVVEEAWFWLVIGGVVLAGAGVTAGVVITSNQAPSGPEQGSLGVIVLMR